MVLGAAECAPRRGTMARVPNPLHLPAAPVPPVHPDAVLWDMDGTLIDTEPCWIAAERELVGSFGGTWTEADAESVIGMTLLDSAARLQAAGVALGAREIAEGLTEIVIRHLPEARFQPGALELLAELRAAGVPSALVTASYRSMADAVVALTPPGSFAVVVPGDEVERGKPDPQPYLLAAERLAVDVRRCVAIEDSPPGITAALASGARTLGVQHMVAVPARPGLSRVSTLAGVDLAVLTAIRHGAVLDRIGDA